MKSTKITGEGVLGVDINLSIEELIVLTSEKTRINEILNRSKIDEDEVRPILKNLKNFLERISKDSISLKESEIGLFGQIKE